MEMMSGVKVEAIWSPVHHDKFIVWGPDITLYEVARIKEIDKKTTFVPISPSRGATVVASQSATGVRCIDISAIPEQPEPLLALGFTSGKVTLATLKQTYDPLGLAGREFVPKYPRLCNSVSWSRTETNMLAVAMDKHRSDHCILLWDVNRGLLPSEEAKDGVIQSPTESRPLAEMALSETAHNVCWANCSNRTLIASMNMKYLKVFDLRDWSNKAVSVGTSRYCGHATASPLEPWQVATRGENTVLVWELRALQRPLLTLPHPRPLHDAAWCPTRRNLLLTLMKDSTSFRLYDIQQANSESKNNNNVTGEALAATAIEAEAEEAGAGGGTGGGAGGGAAAGGAAALEREVTPGAGGGAAPLLAVGWHGAHEARLLAVAAGGALLDYTVCERVTVAWAAGGALAWTAGAARLARSHADIAAVLKDISHVMKKRAQTDYGHKPDLWQNADLADDEQIGAMWHFLALSKSLVEDGCIRGSPWKHPGVRGVLRAGSGEAYRSEAVSTGFGEMGTRRVTVYRSAERARALQLCGWGWGWENAGAGVERAEAAGTPCRAAALAAFHLRVRAALDVLARAAEPQLRVAALALAGLSEERAWRDALAAAAPALPDAYLRALLRFLAATAPAQAPPAAQDFSAVLAETEMRLEDRVAFACIYLDDARLAEWVARQAEALARRGELAGLLLTGVAPEGLQLLARWAERHGDVQTVALVAARCCTAELLRDPLVQHWLDSYRTLLDRWRLWWARCALDALVRGAGGAGGAGDDAARLAGVACTYCGKSVAGGAGGVGRGRAPARLPPPAAKMKGVSSCPMCRKPLPRCAVCARHLGTPAGGAPFAEWFAWCVACRHAGHAHHLLQWFAAHAECPVSSCSCHCTTLDPPDTHAPHTPHHD